jgi:hypothetical protein
VHANFSRLMMTATQLYHTFLFEDFPAAVRISAKGELGQSDDEDPALSDGGLSYITAIATHLGFSYGDIPEPEPAPFELTLKPWNPKPIMRSWAEVEPKNREEREMFFRVLCKGERGKEIMKGAIKDKLFPETLGWSKRVLEVPKISDRNYRQLRFMFNERRNIVADLHWGS